MPVSREQKRPAVFVDRDGVLVRLVSRAGRWLAPQRLEEFAVLPGVAWAVATLRAAGLPVVVVTNQPDLARGLLNPDVLSEMHRRLAAHLTLDAIYVCPHDDGDRCGCRKPLPGLLQAAARDLGLDLGSSFLVGDTWRDIEAGRAAGCTTVLVPPPEPEPALPSADLCAASFSAAARVILRELQRRERRTYNPVSYQRRALGAPRGPWVVAKG